MPAMTMKTLLPLCAALLSACTSAQQPGASPGSQLGFFVTSTGLGRGADLGGLAGADKHCQALAEDVGAGGRTWRAYLSTSAESGTPAVNARDRIGTGPWRNARGVVIAESVAQLHQDNRITKDTALTEKGDTVRGRGDTPNMHDVLTGSQADGTAYPAGGNDMSCRNWTHSGEGAAMVGHHDRTGLDDSAAAKSWNTSHPTRGCSQDALKATGGAGLFYCFAAN
ncbi:hypothetical protein [Azohydromonas australica]|uniref:hypothetical protein n=1 Tax=Azohydromonas australica TaxID=364039 RepID=UPI0004177D62|nr:hypothetical protein [Azohydromonas australica]